MAQQEYFTGMLIGMLKYRNAVQLNFTGLNKMTYLLQCEGPHIVYPPSPPHIINLELLCFSSHHLWLSNLRHQYTEKLYTFKIILGRFWYLEEAFV